MAQPVSLVVGLVVMVAGIVFTLQGVGVMSGSTMSNTTTWSILGPVIALVGVLVVYRATRARGNER
jgi:divalent metal cation (Fe/Co/Zn/Cd) transporter